MSGIIGGLIGSRGGRGGGDVSLEGTFRHGPKPWLFEAATKTAAEAARDAYTANRDNREWLRAYREGRRLVFVALEDTTNSHLYFNAFDETTATSESVFGTTGPPVLPARPSTVLRASGTDAYWFSTAADYDDARLLAREANKAFVAKDPWELTIGSGATQKKFELQNDNYPWTTARSVQSVWGLTWYEPNADNASYDNTGAVVTWPDVPSSTGSNRTTPFVRKLSDGTIEFVIPEGGGGQAAARIRQAVAIWNLNGGNFKPLTVNLTDSGGTAWSGIQIENLEYDILSGSYHFYKVTLENVPARDITSIAAGDVTNWTINGNLPTGYRLFLDIPEQDALTDAAADTWDIQDFDYTHSWFEFGAATGSLSGLTADQVDAAIDAKINGIDDKLLETVGDLSANGVVTFTAEDGSTIKDLDLSALDDVIDITADASWSAADTRARDGKIIMAKAASGGSNTRTLTLPDLAGGDRTRFLVVCPLTTLRFSTTSTAPGNPATRSVGILAWEGTRWRYTAVTGASATFTPSKTNIYAAVKAILATTTNSGTVSADDTNSELDITASGGSFNLYTSASEQFSGAPQASDRFYMADVSDSNKIKYDTWNNHRNYILNSMRAVFGNQDNGLHSDDRMFLTDESRGDTRMEYTTLGRVADFLYGRYGIEVGGLTAVTTLNDTDVLAVGVGTNARKITWANLKALLAGGTAPSGNNLYFGALSVDPSNGFNPSGVTALQSDPALGSGTVQTITITRTWLNNRHFYLIQPAADPDIIQSSITLGGNALTGWTKGTFTTGGTNWEYWKSETAWLSSAIQTQPGSTNVLRIPR